MALPNTPTKYRYQGNSVTYTFDYSGKAFTAADLVVKIITRATDALVETLTLTTDYTVTIATDGTASIEVVAGKIPSSTQDIQIRRELEQSQSTVLPTGTKFPAKAVETALDRAVGLSQDLAEKVDRSLKFPSTTSTTEAVLPEPTDDAVLCFDGTTGAFKIGETNTNLVAGASAASASASAASTSASAASTSATNAASSASAASTSATNAAASAAGVSLPSISISDVAKMLRVNATGDGYEIVAFDLISGFETGDTKYSIKSTPKTGWIISDGSTLGSASSGADYVGDDYEALYEVLWDEVSNANAPVSSGRGASAAADFAANKTITMIDGTNRVLVGAGDTYDVGETAGSATGTPTGSVSGNTGSTTLSEAQLPSIQQEIKSLSSGGVGASETYLSGVRGQTTFDVTITGAVEAFGSGGSHNHTISLSLLMDSMSIVQPSIALYLHIKL